MNSLTFLSLKNSSKNFSKNFLSHSANIMKEKDGDIVNFNLYSCSFLYIFISIGLLSNIMFIISLNTKFVPTCIRLNGRRRPTDNFQQPIIYIIIAITIGDIFYLLNELNNWLLANNFYNEINGLCQLFTYMFNYFHALNECHFIAANFILIHFLCLNENHIMLWNNRRFSLNSSDESSLFERPDMTTINCERRWNNLSLRSIKTNKRNYLNKRNTRRKTDLDLSDTKWTKMKLQLHKINYENLLFYEKIVLLIYSLVLMYLLSWFFWIQEVRVYKIPKYAFNKVFILDFTVCEAVKTARHFLNYYLIIFNFTRLFVSIFSLIVAIFFIKKFNNFLVYFLRKTFKNSFFISKSMEREGKKKKKTIESFFKLSCIDYNSTSTLMPATSEVILDCSSYSSLKQMKLKNNLKFLQFYSIMTIFYSTCVIFNIIFESINRVNAAINDNTDSMINLNLVVNLSIENVLDKKFSPSIAIKYKYYEAFAHSMEIIARSAKFYIYVLFSVHLRCFFRREK